MDVIMDMVCIVGGGVSGIVSARICLTRGLTPVIFDKSSSFGGIWQTDTSMIAKWDSLIANLSKYTMTLSDHLWPEDVPTFPSGDQYYEYISAYIQKFDLLRYFRFNTEIIQVEIEENGYQVLYKNQLGIFSKFFKYVIIANGKFSKPRNSIKYRERFKGESVFAGFYRDPSIFQGKNVVIVGIGYSACDIALEASKSALSVTQVHKGKFVKLTRTHEGIPIDLISLNFPLLHQPQVLFNSLQENKKVVKSLITAFGNPGEILESLRLSEEEINSSYISFPITYEEYYQSLKSGEIKLQEGRAVEYCTSGIILSSGVTLSADLIVDATGYSTNLDFLGPKIKEILDFDPEFHHLPVTLYRSCLHHQLPGFGFVGRNVSFLVEIAAEIVIQWITQTLHVSLQDIEDGVKMEKEFRAESNRLPWVYTNEGLIKDFIMAAGVQINWELVEKLEFSKGFISSVFYFQFVEDQEWIGREYVRMMKKDFPGVRFG